MDPDEVLKWQKDIDDTLKVRKFAARWLKKTFPTRNFALSPPV
jgi:hypothetical protein